MRRILSPAVPTLYDWGFADARRPDPFHQASVTAAAWGLRGTRKAEEGAERARLKVSDVMAEARERIGEEVPPPPILETDNGHKH
jgi:hypothetical protein